jgi:drug/metabolite transporter (DMT)-like permease
MKKIASILIIMISPLVASAQDRFLGYDFRLNMEVFRTCSIIFLIALVMIFVLSVLKRFLEFRIKNKIIERGVNENLVSSILKPNTREDGSVNFKWFSMLAGMGIGLTMVNYTLPLGIHSLAIMSFSMAASFLGYHYFLKRASK